MAEIYAAAFADDRPWSAEEIRALLNSPSTFCIRCPDGFAIGRIIVDEVELLTIAVHPRAQGQGQGRQILRDFHLFAAERGGQMVFLEVADDNSTAIRLYSTLGYRQSGRRKGYYRRPGGASVDALLMSKALQPLLPAGI